MRFGWSANDTSARLRGTAKIAAAIAVAVYVVLYSMGPFPDSWNESLLYLLLVIAASAAATLATLICRRYDKTEIHHRIWRYFAIGLWLWVAAEATYAYLDITQEEVAIGLPDVFWVTAYIFFAHALGIQYRILAQPSKRTLVSQIAIVLLFAILCYALVYHLLSAGADAQGRYDTIVNSFYPVGDLFLALVAVWLVRHFSGGVFARPWLGLLAFSFTDLLFAWIEAAGLYDRSETLTTLFDTTYLGAYLLLGLGLLSLWAFLKYGMRSHE